MSQKEMFYPTEGALVTIDLSGLSIDAIEQLPDSVLGQTLRSFLGNTEETEMRQKHRMHHQHHMHFMHHLHHMHHMHGLHVSHYSSPR